MCCFYPGNVICLNALRSPGARPAAVLVFLLLGCQSKAGLRCGKAGLLEALVSLWGLDLGPAVYWGLIPLRRAETLCGEGQHCLRSSKQKRLNRILTGRESSAVWS